ncbi:MAG: hemerythrin domain-containing protein [Planctomycetaceae bacterium]|nr:hemerythrin domain-containing protein [Planctomycetaceae bacterium]
MAHKATEILKHEHDVILMVVQAVQRQIEGTAEGQVPDWRRLAEILEFFAAFVDRCHHRKEEKCLFPQLCQHGMHCTEEPIAVLLDEHQQGRQYLATLRDAIVVIRRSLLEYSKLLHRHIEKENTEVFPVADQLVSEEEDRELERRFDQIEQQEIGPGVHERYHQMAHELAEQLQGVPPR